MKHFSWVAWTLACFFLLAGLSKDSWAKDPAHRMGPKKVSPSAFMGDMDKRTQDAVLSSLETGNAKYRKGFAKTDPASHQRRLDALGLKGPKAMILACADPRVIPEEVFGAAPGELFVVRVAGNVATKETVASLEYGAEVLGIPVLVVLGHQSCTVVKACMEAMETPDPQHRRSMVIESLYRHMEPACKEAKKEGLEGERLLNKAVEANVRNSMRAALENSPSMWNLRKSGKLRVVGALYSKQTGQVYWLDR